MPQKIFKPLDFAVIAAVAALALTAAIPVFAGGRIAGGQFAASEASVSYDGGTIELPLARDCVYEIESGGYTLKITVADGAVSVSEADCPDRFCVGQGKIARSGQAIVCLPARVLIEIKGGDNHAGRAAYDEVAG